VEKSKGEGWSCESEVAGLIFFGGGDVLLCCVSSCYSGGLRGNVGGEILMFLRGQS
jgi:hypothetical protein